MSVNRIMNVEIQKTSHDLEPIQTVAKVLRSDHMNNVCDIQFVDGRNRDNVPVRVYGDGMDWFPQEDDLVMVYYGRDVIEIISRVVTNFGRDILPDMSFDKDKFSDYVGGPIASSCTGV